MVDALKLTPANPSFLAARDAIMMAADRYAAAHSSDDDERADFVHAVWEASPSYGMGPAARTAGANTVSGAVADFTVPPRPVPEPEPEPDPGQIVAGAASPMLSIPDNDLAGVSSTIDLPDAGDIATLQVSVDIRHPYRGDLVVTLSAPDGRLVPLHNRAGGSADDVRQAWRSDAHTGLAQLVGMPTAGTWTLMVTDRAPRDLGTLNEWSLEATVAEVRPVVEVEATPSLVIPDDTVAGVESELTVVDGGVVSALQLDVDITHTYVGDLEVTLTGPDGTSVKVHGRSGGSADHLITSYRSEDGGRLEPFVGTSVAGVWRLSARDLAGLDVGKLNRWKLTARL